ncbi:AAA family ATPase [Orrella daihaiensis]|uniref:ATP-binding protein n=1 Tax=Orrella daihaiensis TaxID=2782176 RepID=A0ABY4AME1_9BURK|nr:ATP-binding protein [Orrella daihaiensis]UOD51447.1 ATP-binding protein [Orrella daihaiensis]
MDLSVGVSAPDNYHFLDNPCSSNRVAKVAGIYGANASGKTNLLRVLSALADFVSESFSYKLEDATPFRPHFFNTDAPVGIHVEFVLSDAEGAEPNCYRYDLEIAEQVVRYERLRIKSSKLFSRVFERQWVDGQYQIQGLGEKLSANLRKNVSWLAWLAQHNLPQAVSIVQYFKQVRSNLTPRGPRMPGLYNTLDAIDIFRKNPGLSQSMLAQLNRWDIDIQDVVYERIDAASADPEDGTGPWMAYCVHQLANQEARLSILNESSGTVGLFSLLSIVLPVLRDGGVAIIDEIEADLHPHMLRAVIDLFVQPVSNPYGSQLLFTSHADWLMNLLHKTQIYLVDKLDTSSEVVRLSDIRGVAARDNFSARYRAGAYGAVPDIQ